VLRANCNGSSGVAPGKNASATQIATLGARVGCWRPPCSVAPLAGGSRRSSLAKMARQGAGRPLSDARRANVAVVRPSAG
jgi:hypothetical protein